MKKIRYLFLFALFLPVLFTRPLFAQNITGFIYEKLADNPKSPLVGVNVFWAGTTRGAFTDEKGKFHISMGGIKDPLLVVSMLGYRKDTIKITNDKMKPEIELLADKQQLGEVEVKGKAGQLISFRKCAHRPLPLLPRVNCSGLRAATWLKVLKQTRLSMFPILMPYQVRARYSFSDYLVFTARS